MPLPLYKLLNVQAVLPAQTIQLNIASLADVIAVDLLEHTLTDSLMTLKAQAQILSFP